MGIYTGLVFPILARIDAEQTHNMTLRLLEQTQKTNIGRALLRLVAGPVPSGEKTICGLKFPNRLGVAAGFDKDAQVVAALSLLGFGHVEVGTLTPRAQPGNSRPRIFRLRDEGALVNRMGFPNEGIQSAVERLKRASGKKKGFLIGVSIGKQKETSLLAAVDDYLLTMRPVYPYADFLSINISSPNTPGLRELQNTSYLSDLLNILRQEGLSLSEHCGVTRRPLFVKISPDLSWNQLDDILDCLITHHIDGVIATNTSIERSHSIDPASLEEGGLSGRPLKKRSTEIVSYIKRQTGDLLPIIGVGGVFNHNDFQEKIDAGADIVQIYTGLVYEGPGIAGRILHGFTEGKVG